jgi:negative regulator of flagellin synthesis FlgM
MIISGKPISNINKIYGEQNQVTKNAKTNKSQATQGKDEFILSSSAQEFGKVFNAIRGLSDTRQEKVNEISAKINNGTYQVDSRNIAAKMIGTYIE